MSQPKSEELKGIVSSYVDIWNQHDPTALDTVFATDAVRHDPATGTSEGIESIRAIMQTLLNSFPDLVISVDQALADEDCVILRWTASGTHNGDFQGIPPSGKSFSVKGNSVYQCAGGKIIAEHTVWDTLGLLKQLGVIPA
jgi:steroid delta-isomerase-like uncharacterized protein